MPVSADPASARTRSSRPDGSTERPAAARAERPTWEVEAEFAREYAATPRIVFSDSLESVAPGCRLVRRADAIDEVVRLKKETDGDLSVGGAGLAASLLDLIDEFRPRVVPAFLGGGKPYVPLGADLRLRLVEQRAFRNGTVYLRYERIG
jgi:dihydrofolate reductase